MMITPEPNPPTPPRPSGWGTCYRITVAGLLVAVTGMALTGAARTGARLPGSTPDQDTAEPAAATHDPERMRELDFMLGEITCRFNNGTTMTGEVQPILGGAFYQMRLRSWDAEGKPVVTDGCWTIGWSEPDRAYLSYYFDSTGMQGHSSSPGWENGVLKFTGTHVLIGGKIRTGTRDEFKPIDENHFVLTSYYQDKDGAWQFYDSQDCRRER